VTQVDHLYYSIEFYKVIVFVKKNFDRPVVPDVVAHSDIFAGFSLLLVSRASGFSKAASKCARPGLLSCLLNSLHPLDFQ